MIDAQHDGTILNALQQWPNNPQPAAEMLRPAADAGDARALGLIAYMLGGQGRWPEGAEYADRADADGVPFIAWWYAQNLVGQGDPALRGRAADLMVRGMQHFPGGPDPFSFAQQLVQQGDPQAALNFLTQLVELPGAPWRQQIEAAVSSASAALEGVQQTGQQIATERDRVSGVLGDVETAARRELESVQRLGREVGEIAADKAADYLAKGYGREADQMQTRADVATALSLILGIGIAIAAIVIATRLPADDTFHNAVEKAASPCRCSC